MNERMKNIVWLVIVLVGFGLISVVRGGSSVYLNFDDDALTVTAPENFSYTLPYEDVARIELIDEFDAGTLLSGSETRKFHWGVWENDRLGEYTLCAYKKIDNALLITEKDGDLLVINYESEETTTSLADMIPQLIESKLSS